MPENTEQDFATAEPRAEPGRPGGQSMLGNTRAEKARPTITGELLQKTSSLNSRLDDINNRLTIILTNLTGESIEQASRPGEVVSVDGGLGELTRGLNSALDFGERIAEVVARIEGI